MWGAVVLTLSTAAQPRLPKPRLRMGDAYVTTGCAADLTPSFKYPSCAPLSCLLGEDDTTVKAYLDGVPPSCVNVAIDQPCADSSDHPLLFWCTWTHESGGIIKKGPYRAVYTPEMVTGTSELLALKVYVECTVPTLAELQFVGQHVPMVNMTLGVVHHGSGESVAIPFAGIEDGDVVTIPGPRAPPSPPPLAPPWPSVGGTHDKGWTYVAEMIDDKSVDDWPDSPDTIAEGFSNGNAYYIGNAALAAMRIGHAQFCMGKGEWNMFCLELRPQEAGSAFANAGLLSDMPSTVHKMVAATAGGCAHTNAYSSGFFWECNDAWCDTDDPLSCPTCSDRASDYGIALARDSGDGEWSIPGSSGSYRGGYGGHTQSGGFRVWHWWGSGATLYSGSDDELRGSSSAYNIDRFQLRVQPFEGAPSVGGPHDKGWTYVAEMIDDKSVDDWPDGVADIQYGFVNGNAYYIGNAALAAMNFGRAQFCMGKGEWNMFCLELRPQEAGSRYCRKQNEPCKLKRPRWW